jgi:peptidoglycan/LPS O-acetylase OafA/YrhL
MQTHPRSAPRPGSPHEPRSPLAQGPPQAGRITELEALRGVAILMVLVEHLPINLFYGFAPFYHFLLRHWRGQAGVDFFFAISGFVIARSLAPRLWAAAAWRRRRVVIAFWIRRVTRLAPAAWLWVLVPLTLAATFNRSGAFHSPHDDAMPAVAALLNVANIYFALTWPAHDAGITIPYWSLSLEEQFYLLFPFLVLLLRRRLAMLMAAVVAAQFFMPDAQLAEMLRPGAIAAGVLLALLATAPAYAAAAPRFMAGRPWPRLAVLLACVVLAGALLGHAWGLPFGVKWGCVALVSAALVFVASFDRGYLLQDGPARRVLLWIGVRSYSLYLVHMPAYAMARELALRANLPVAAQDLRAMAILLALAVPMVLMAAMATYRFVETPLRLRGKAFAAAYERGGASARL